MRIDWSWLCKMVDFILPDYVPPLTRSTGLSLCRRPHLHAPISIGLWPVSPTYDRKVGLRHPSSYRSQSKKPHWLQLNPSPAPRSPRVRARLLPIDSGKAAREHCRSSSSERRRPGRSRSTRCAHIQDTPRCLSNPIPPRRFPLPPPKHPSYNQLLKCLLRATVAQLRRDWGVDQFRAPLAGTPSIRRGSSALNSYRGLPANRKPLRARLLSRA